MKELLFSQDTLFEEDRYVLYTPKIAKIKPPFPEKPIVEPPTGGLILESDFERAHFLAKAAINCSSFNDVQKALQEYFLFQELIESRKKGSTKQQETLSEPAKQAIKLRTAEGEALQEALLFFVPPNDPHIDLLKEAILIARVDSRFYTPSDSRIGMDRSERSRFELRETAHAEAWAMEHRSKIEMLANVQPILQSEGVYTPEENTIEAVLKETVLIDETLTTQQRSAINALIHTFSSKYSLAIGKLYEEGLLQQKSENIYEILQLATSGTTPLEGPLKQYTEQLATWLSLLNRIRTAFVDAEQRTTTTSCIEKPLVLFSQKEVELALPHSLPFFLAFDSLMLLIHSTSWLEPYHKELSVLCQGAPGIFALAVEQIEHRMFVRQERITTSFDVALVAAINLHLSKMLLEKEPDIWPLLTAMGYISENANANANVHDMAAQCTVVAFCSLVQVLLYHPDYTPKEKNLWDKPALTPVAFFNQLIDSKQLPPCSFLLEKCAIPSMDKESELKKIVDTGHIRGLGQNGTIEALLHSIDELLATVVPARNVCTVQLFHAAREQAKILRAFLLGIEK